MRAVTTIDFRSDNTHGALPEVIEAIARANAGTMTSYGSDDVTRRVRDRCRELFEHRTLEVFPILTGTAGNALAIAAMTPPWGAVLCHDEAHIQRDELGAPEFYSGAKLIPSRGALGKLRAEEIEVVQNAHVLSLTNATEAGTVYSIEEMRALGEFARRHELRVHLDGARFANAIAALDCAPADASWRAGVDVLVFGGTKNGAAAAELLVVFDPALAKEIAPRYHRAGHRLSKSRFLSAQMEALLTDDLWLRTAKRTNALARRLAAGLGEVLQPVEANIVFARVASPRALRDAGFLFHDWRVFGENAIRLVAGWGTSEAEVDAFIASAASC